MQVPGRVYPRVCGGTGTWRLFADAVEGLSPRVRGNHPAAWADAGSLRSIPACAGEPDDAETRNIEAVVYPRVCGGTLEINPNRMASTGLSPRVRGNLIEASKEAAKEGSIPACAGEPAGGSSESLSGRVYPRVCGGTGLS